MKRPVALLAAMALMLVGAGSALAVPEPPPSGGFGLTVVKPSVAVDGTGVDCLSLGDTVSGGGLGHAAKNPSGVAIIQA